MSSGMANKLVVIGDRVDLDMGLVYEGKKERTFVTSHHRALVTGWR